MGMFPCDVGPHRYSGPQQTIYPAIALLGNTFRRKLRLCDGHFNGYLEHLVASCADAAVDFTEAERAQCALCGKRVVDDAGQFFATVYARGAERHDFWACVHDDCVAGLAEDWLIDATMP